jgi:hypothetical protein
MSIRHFKYFFTIFAALFFIGGRPMEFGRENVFFHGFPMAQPVISIGLEPTDRHPDPLLLGDEGLRWAQVHLVADDAEEAPVKAHGSPKFLLSSPDQGTGGAENLAADLGQGLRPDVYRRD